MQVLKFGGTSVASAKTISTVVGIVRNAVKFDTTVLVASAIAGATDELERIGKLAESGNIEYIAGIANLRDRHLAIIRELLPEAYQSGVEKEILEYCDQLQGICEGVRLIGERSFKSNDLIVSFGELMSTRIIYARFLSVGVACKWMDSRKLIKTEYKNSANVADLERSYENIRQALEEQVGKLIIVPGFIASDAQGRATTLGRGGSDFTASLFAVASDARILEIWTDVNGMMTADPRVVPSALTIEHISYKEAQELSHFGAKVVYPPTIQPVIAKGIPILVKNTFDPQGPGTLIEKNPPASLNRIKGISRSNRITLLSMEGSGMVGIPGYSSRLFQALAQNGINIILITQASSVHTMLVAIDEKDASKAKEAVDECFAYEISLGKVEPLKIESGFSIISLIGDDLKNRSGSSGRMFEALGREGIIIRAIAQGSSEKNVSAVVATADADRAVRAIHEEFFKTGLSRRNVFIAGAGKVGKALISTIEEQQEKIKEKCGVDLKIVAVCNSRQILIDSQNLFEGISPAEMADRIINLAIPQSVFVDCTSSPLVSARYAELLASGINVVSCNKIANSGPLDYYKEIKDCAKLKGASYKYETTVGAALPVISLLRQVIQSGDEVESIEACLSGTLNYLFSSYDSSTSFETVVSEALAAGYTEPDPMTDLKGVDVLRKAVILAREIGQEVEEKDVVQASFLPADWPDEEHFSNLYEEASARGERLRYIANIKKDCVQVGLKSIPASHPLYDLKGSDNAVLIYSKLYPRGLKVQGAGAGALQTAQGLLNDIITL